MRDGPSTFRFPLRLMLVVVALSLLIGESFPFSRFRMYSTFLPSAGYFYVADGDGRPLPFQREFGMRTAFLKKRFKAVLEQGREAEPERDEDEVRTAAGERTLLSVMENRQPETDRPTPLDRVRLYRVIVTADAGALVRSKTLIAEIEAP